MMKKSEVLAVIGAIAVMTVILLFSDNELNIALLGESLFISIIIIGVSVLSKKITSRQIDVETEISIWQWKRYWITRGSEFKNPIPFGILLPLLFAFISAGFFKFLAFLQFNAKALPAKAVKKYSQARYAGIMEWDDAQIVFFSTIAVLAVSIIAKLLSPSAIIFAGLAKYSLYYALYNLIPLSQLDGLRLLFGSKPLYVFTLILAGISALIVLF